MALKSSIHLSKQSPHSCFDILLSDHSSSSSSSDSSLFSSLTSSPSHHESFPLPSIEAKKKEFRLSHCLIETVPSDSSVRTMVSAGDRVFSAHHGDHKIRVWMKTHKKSKGEELEDSEKSLKPFISQHKQVCSMPRRKDCFIKSLSQGNYVQVRRHEKRLWIEHSDTISCLALGCVGSTPVLYSGSWDKSIKVWRLKDLKCLEAFRAHHDALHSIVASPDGFLYTSSSDGTIKVWTLRERPDHSKSWFLKKKKRKMKHACIATLCEVGHGHAASASVNSLALSNNGELLFSAGSDGVVCVWGRGEGQDYIGELRYSLQAHKLPILCLCIATTIDGDILLTGSADKTVSMWQIDATAHEIESDASHTSSKGSIENLDRNHGYNDDSAPYQMSQSHDSCSDVLLGTVRVAVSERHNGTVLDTMSISNTCMSTERGHTRVDFTHPSVSLVQRKLQRRNSSRVGDHPDMDLHHNNERGSLVHAHTHLRHIGVLEGHNGPVKAISISSNQHDRQHRLIDRNPSCTIYTRSADRTIKVWSLSNCIS